MFGWFRPREGPEERPRGYREPDAPIVADIDLRNAPRRSRAAAAGYVAMSALALWTSLRALGSGTESAVSVFSGFANLLWPIWTLRYLWRTRRRIDRLLLRSDGQVALEQSHGAGWRVGRLRLLRRPLFGWRGRKRAFDLGLKLVGTRGVVEVLAGHRLDPGLRQTLEEAGGPPETARGFGLLSVLRPDFRAEPSLPAPSRAPGPLSVRGLLEVRQGRATPLIRTMVPLLGASAALGVAASVALMGGWWDTNNLVGGFVVSAVLVSVLHIVSRRHHDVTVVRSGDEVLLHRSGDVVIRLPAAEESLDWQVGRRGEVRSVFLRDAHGNVALTLGPAGSGAHLRFARLLRASGSGAGARGRRRRRGAPRVLRAGPGDARGRGAGGGSGSGAALGSRR